MSSDAPVPARGSRWPTLASVVLLAAAGFFAVRTVQVARAFDPINPVVGVTPFSDPTERIGRLHDVTGTFATGNSPGDRVIVVQGENHIQFKLVGPLESTLVFDDRFELGRVGDKIILSTKHSGPVEAVGIDELSFFGDTYRRTK